MHKSKFVKGQKIWFSKEITEVSGHKLVLNCQKGGVISPLPVSYVGGFENYIC